MIAPLIGRVRSLALALAALLGIGAGVATINTIYSSIAIRDRWQATLRAIGFSHATVAAAVFVEAVLLGCVGGLVGALAAWGVTRSWGFSLLNAETHTPVALDAEMTPSTLIFGVAAGALLSALAAVVPSIGIARKDLVETLRG